MFNKNLFDRSSYDRSVASDGINIGLLSAGHMRLQLVATTPISGHSLLSQGSLETHILCIVPAGTMMTAFGGLDNSEVILSQPLYIKLSGIGTTTALPIVRTPIDRTAVAGSGTLESVNSFVYQHTYANLMGNGDATFDVTPRQMIDSVMRGSSNSGVSNLILKQSLIFNLNGAGAISLRRLGTLNEDLFQLLGIDLQPGEEVTIDTDLFDVIFGYQSNVVSITSDSVFFDLQPGGNEINISTDTNETLQITAIWQNRWL